jgi:hypothetical protein
VTKPAQATAQVLVIASGEHPATVLAEPPDGIRVGGSEAVADIDGHEPQLVVAEFVDMAQHRVVVAAVGPVSRDHFEPGCAQLVGQQREASDIPVVGMCRDGRLQQDSRHRIHFTPTEFGAVDSAGTRRCWRAASSASPTSSSIGLPGTQSIVTVKRHLMSSRLLASE